ncbi:AAA family ATPase [Nocardia veterana]|uniref:MoxR family ATPase n=1 Tax=Nocardia veterana TaxID=132249 RepID=A0A7X6LT92_9NOCA|nr:MoxR family ATPase [Nocardia veterana]NKY84047.1 MoxR family ATPase [Nocardia veterana]
MLGVEETTLRTPAQRVLDEVDNVVIGKRPIVTAVLTAILAGGHVLVEDLPGLGKTLLAKSFARALGLNVTRVQFTPDMLPADLVGSTIFDARTGNFEYRPGPIFSNIVIADEINRTAPKTQSALLEAMAEGQVSVDGTTRPLPSPFLVLATENPIEHEGTYPLPNAQLDRFAVRLRLGYLTAGEEKSLLRRRVQSTVRDPVAHRVVELPDVLRMRESVDAVIVHDDILEYIVALVRSTRSHIHIEVGASPRAQLDLLQLARAHALLAGRDFVIPDDVKALAVPVLAHRVSLRPEMWLRRIRGETVIEEIVSKVPAPRVSVPGAHGRTH